MTFLIKTLSSSLAWVFVDKFFRLFLVLASEILLARYLGPEKFGIYNYIIAIYSLFLVVSSFGLDNNLVKDLVNFPDQHHLLITSGVFIKLVAGFCAYFIATILAYYLNHDIVWAIALTNIILLFQWLKVFELYYQSQGNFKLIALCTSFTGLCFFFLKVSFVLQQRTIISFCIVYILELIVVGLVILMIYMKDKKILFQLNLMVIRRHLQISWPLVFSGIAVSVTLKIDQVMLQQLAGSTALGVYAAAIKLSEGWYFFGGLLTTVIAPKIYFLHQTNYLAYKNLLQKITAYLFLLALAIVIFISFASEVLIDFLYGINYQGAASILKIHIWALFFAYLGCVQAIYWIAEGIQKIFLYQNLCSAILNIFLNLLLIPEYQGIGAAWATLIAYGLPVLIVPYIVPRAKFLHQIHAGALQIVFSIISLKVDKKKNGLN
jgi:O-antigen/teichoic acid export membrane protein